MNKAKRNIRWTPGERTLVLTAALLVFFPGAVLRGGEKSHRRDAALLLSDGTTTEGKIMLTPGRSFSLTLFEPGQDAASSKGFNKVRNFDVDVVKEMTFRPYKERYERRFTFSDPVAGTGKTYQGEPYPVSELQCSVVFNSGEECTGVLNSIVIYLKEKDPDTGMTVTNRKFFLTYKQKSEPGDKLADLVYVKRIRMLDEGQKIERSLPLELLSLDPASARDLKAMTQDTLTGVPVKVDEQGKKIEILSTLGENVFLAARIGDRYVAGWPAEGTQRTELFKSIEEQLMKKEDYYNERKLLGILPLDNGRRVLTLVSLRRRVPENASGYPGAFEFDKDGKRMEFFRLGVWLWHRDPRTGTMALVDRGSFYRVRVDEKAETPPAGICPDLWPIVKREGKILVGEEKGARP